MNGTGANDPQEPDASLGWRFSLRRVAFGEAGQLLQASIGPYRAFPLRLTGMFLLLWVPILVLAGVPTLGPFLSDAVAALAFTGYTYALDAAARADPPSFQHLGVVLRFSPDKLVLLVVSGLLPILVGVLVLALVWGLGDTADFLNALTAPDGHPSAQMELHLRAVDYLAGIPFTLVAPVWALYRWSGSRSMAANLLACLANWRWVLALTAFTALAESLLLWLRGQGSELTVLSDVGLIGLQMLTLSWTLALAQRSFPPR